MRHLPTVLFFVLIALCCATTVQARPQFLPVLVSSYPQQASNLQTRSCLNCHTGPGQFTRNAYGTAIQTEMSAEGASMLTPTIVHKVETQQAAPGLKTFGELIQAGQPPAAPIPASAAPTASPQVAATPLAPAQSSPFAFLPTNAMHPAVVHFPIALFFVGLFLDALGLIRKDATMLLAGWYNLAAAAVSSLGAVATGFIAIYLMKLPVQGLIREHMTLALIATVVMWVMFALRVHRHEKINIMLRVAYYALAVAELCLISYVGHLGGKFVYGG